MSSCQNNIYKKPPRSLVVGLTGGWTSPVALRKQTRGATPSSPAICHFRWGHPRRGGGAGNKGKVQEVFFFFFFSSLFLWVGFFVSIYCGHVLRARHFFPPVRFYAQRHRADWAERSQRGQKKRQRASRGHALVEVVVCAVGRVVILPLVEMTAQSTALPALVTCDRGGEPDRRGRLSSLCLQTE